jgi:hypothetical protein
LNQDVLHAKLKESSAMRQNQPAASASAAILPVEATRKTSGFGLLRGPWLPVLSILDNNQPSDFSMQKQTTKLV